MIEEYFSPSLIGSSPFRIVVASVLIIALLFGCLWIYSSKQVFPDIPEGYYVGTISGLKRFDGSAPLFIIRRGDDMSIFLSGMSGKILNLEKSSDSKRSPVVSANFKPLEVSFEDHKFRLIGKNESEGQYSGEIWGIAGRERGRWKMEFIPLKEPSESIDPWLLEYRDRQLLGNSLKVIEQNLSSRKEEITKLSRYLAEGKLLKTQAEKKLIAEEELLSAVTKKHALRTEAVESLRRQVRLAQQLSPYGRLVSLSRQSFEKESEWFFLGVKRGLSNKSPEIDWKTEH